MGTEHNVARIHETLDSLGIDRDELLVVGGSVLSLCGIRPANDVDILVPSPVFLDIHQTAKTPSGVNIRRNEHGKSYIVSTPGNDYSGPMHTDIIFDYGVSDHTTYSDYDQELMNRIQTAPLSNEGWHFVPLEVLMEQYRKRRSDGRARSDRKLVEHHLKFYKSDHSLGA